MTQKTASPELVKVSDLAAELNMDEFVLRLALDKNNVDDADEVEVITAQDAEAIRLGHKLYMQGAEIPPQSESEAGGAIAVQSNSQIAQVSQESRQLSEGVITILQELGVQRKLVEGHQQGLIEVAAYEAGRSAVLESFAQQELEATQRAMKDCQAFDLQQALKDLGVTLPGDRLPGLGETTTSALNNLRKSAQQCTSSPWKK